MQCQKKKRDGKRCRAPALAGKKYCALHAEPGRAAALGRKGGCRRTVCSPDSLKEFVAPQSAADLRDLLAEAIIEIRAGKLDPKVGNALGYLGTSLLRALEASDTERRLDALEGQHRKMENIVFPIE